MLAYRDGSRRADARHELLHLARRARSAAGDPDAALSLLIEAGIVETALADAVFPDRDGLDPLVGAAGQISRAAARVWLARQRGDACAVSDVVARLDELLERPLPASIALRIPEGFAYYALFPETYVEAARAFNDALRPARICICGLRSIGTTLAAVVAEALVERGAHVWSYTVRPRGHPFAREWRLDTALAARLRAEAAAGACFVVVDEGPGLSGSSFASSATALEDLGIDRDRIVFLPAWDPAPEQLNSESARRAWSAHRRFCADAASIGITPERVFGVSPGIDFSGGRWREHIYPSRADWPDIHAPHERWKVFLPQERRLIRFAGLGAFGSAARERAVTLAAHGLGPPPGQLRHGFLDLPFVEGTPSNTAPAGSVTPEVAGAYVARVAALFPAAACVEADPLIAMVGCNMEQIHPDTAHAIRPALEMVRLRLTDTAAAAIDGRMLPHEWIATPRGPVKVDALDHHRDHFFPGLQSPAWDLAAAAVEFAWCPARNEQMLRAFERAGGDAAARPLLPFYTLAYAAFRAGYASLAGIDGARARYSQCALNAAVCFSASSKSPRKQIARSSMNT